MVQNKYRSKDMQNSTTHEIDSQLSVKSMKKSCSGVYIFFFKLGDEKMFYFSYTDGKNFMLGNLMVA